MTNDGRVTEPLHRAKLGGLTVYVFADAEAASTAAARAAGLILSSASRRLAQGVLVAAAPSQTRMLAGLAKDSAVDWRNLTIFQLDEYVGLPVGHPRSFGTFITENLADCVPYVLFERMDGSADPDAERHRYGLLTASRPIALACLGIGENGHLAFNEPETADFSSLERCTLVRLGDMSRAQQVHDGTFGSIDEVPSHALTLTIPVLMSAAHVVVTVLGSRKRDAVRHTLFGPIDTSCPASILRRHRDAALFMDLGAWGDTAGSGDT